MAGINGRKILFVGIGFYDYEKVIKNNLEDRGAQVCYISSCIHDRWVRLLGRLNMTSHAVERLQTLRTSVLRATPGDNDVVFIIKGQDLTQKDINLLRERNPRAEFILYLWDSLIRHDNAELLLSNFYNIWSFDRVDCTQNPKLKFRPLFYRQIPVSQPKQYDLSFIGWLHSDRLKIARTLRGQLAAQGKNFHIKLYGGKFSYFMGRYITRRIKPSDREFIIFRSIPYIEFQRITAASRVVLDIAHPLQSGLTIRTIETLAAGCHLLTTNADIVHYTDIPTGCYTVFDRDTPMVPEVSNTAHFTLSESFSLSGFINDIFS